MYTCIENVLFTPLCTIFTSSPGKVLRDEARLHSITTLPPPLQIPQNPKCQISEKNNPGVLKQYFQPFPVWDCPILCPTLRSWPSSEAYDEMLMDEAEGWSGGRVRRRGDGWQASPHGRSAEALVDNLVDRGLLVSRTRHDVFIIRRNVTAQDGRRLLGLRNNVKRTNIRSLYWYIIFYF